MPDEAVTMPNSLEVIKRSLQCIHGPLRHSAHAGQVSQRTDRCRSQSVFHTALAVRNADLQRRHSMSCMLPGFTLDLSTRFQVIKLKMCTAALTYLHWKHIVGHSLKNRIVLDALLSRSAIEQVRNCPVGQDSM